MLTEAAVKELGAIFSSDGPMVVNSAYTAMLRPLLIIVPALWFLGGALGATIWTLELVWLLQGCDRTVSKHLVGALYAISWYLFATSWAIITIVCIRFVFVGKPKSQTIMRSVRAVFVYIVVFIIVLNSMALLYRFTGLSLSSYFATPCDHCLTLMGMTRSETDALFQEMDDELDRMREKLVTWSLQDSAPQSTHEVLPELQDDSEDEN